MRMAYLHDTDGSPVLVGPAQVTTVFPLAGGGCVVTTSDGGSGETRESIDEVREELDAALNYTEPPDED